ncbi:histidine kinase [Leptospira broomii serovar Hurstbridge str. 5399]|uniref:histidine kinase n=1 Tax=Leptospira broomii serovar Hurstbridge str. 5399 TaxID=1049789 RepID=T0GMN8_9LEPT|nr:histidine kinase dimerization/phosphoacceptor domain -containing protein [Leptospira broomii]EQA46598.1 histidine kinase [Leptospira broomii serovar Hurstbridge str. 5399]
MLNEKNESGIGITSRFCRKKFLLPASLLFFFISVIIPIADSILGYSIQRLGLIVGGIASFISIILILYGKYIAAVYICSISFCLALCVGTFWGTHNIAFWFPTVVLFHLFFASKKHTVFVFVFCLLLSFIQAYLRREELNFGVLTDSIGSLIVLSVIGLMIATDLEKLLLQKNSLIQELNHRVRNNLQVVLGLISLLKASNEWAAPTLNILERRVLALSSVHDIDSDPSDPGKVPMSIVFADYLNRIAAEAIRFPKINIPKNETFLTIKDAIFMAMIAGEIITTGMNSQIESSVSERLINIEIDELETDLVELKITGIAIVLGQGVEFIELLAEQLGAKLRVAHDEEKPISIVTFRKST